MDLKSEIKNEKKQNGKEMMGLLSAIVTAFAGGTYLAVSICCLLYTSPSPRDRSLSRMPSSA